MTPATDGPKPANVRCASLDVFRGFAVSLMVIVNNPGSRRHLSPLLRHAGWTGCNLADLVFPFFLFIMGAAAAFSLPAHSSTAAPGSSRVLRRIVRRTLLLCGTGVALNLMPPLIRALAYDLPFDAHAVRLTGVLQRIGLVYGMLAVAVVYLPRRVLWVCGAAILAACWAALMLVPVPGYGSAVLTPEGNLFFFLDRGLIGPNLLSSAARLDPEGLCTTPPALVTAIIGYASGAYLRAHPACTTISLRLVLTAAASLTIGYAWGMVLPVSKDLWTSSFVLVSAGWSLLVLAVCHELFDVKNLRSLGLPLRVMGVNALLLFVGSGLVARLLLNLHTGAVGSSPILWSAAYHAAMVPVFGDNTAGSLAFSLLYLALWWLVLYLLYRRGIIIRV